MNIFSNLAKNLGKTEDDLTDEEIREAKRAEQRKHDRSTGPRKVKYLTNGQVRRMQERDQRSQHRKTNRRYRRDWMSNQQALANLKGQVRVCEQLIGTPDLIANAAIGLAKKFPDAYEELGSMGPVRAGREHLDAVLTSAARARKA